MFAITFAIIRVGPNISKQWILISHIRNKMNRKLKLPQRLASMVNLMLRIPYGETGQIASKIVLKIIDIFFEGRLSLTMKSTGLFTYNWSYTSTSTCLKPKKGLCKWLWYHLFFILFFKRWKDKNNNPAFTPDLLSPLKWILYLYSVLWEPSCELNYGLWNPLQLAWSIFVLIYH